MKLLATLPVGRKLLELDVSSFESFDDPFELGLVLLKGRFAHSARAPNLPDATSTVRPVPGGGGSLTKASPARTIA